MPEIARWALCSFLVRRTIIERIAIQEISESQISDANAALQRFKAGKVSY
jgi:hypothetical protein